MIINYSLVINDVKYCLLQDILNVMFSYNVDKQRYLHLFNDNNSLKIKTNSKKDLIFLNDLGIAEIILISRKFKDELVFDLEQYTFLYKNLKKNNYD